MGISISNQQLESFKPYLFENYISELVAHSNKNFPHLHKTLGEPQLREVLRNSVKLAQSKGITQRGPVQSYIDMLAVFGYGFETDPQYLWIQKIINKNKELPQMKQAMYLYAEVIQYLNKVCGEENEYMIQAAFNLKKMNLDNVKLNSDSYIVDILAQAFPQKFEATSREQIKALIVKAITKSEQQYGFYASNSKALVTILMFLFGHEFDHDPFYPWARIEATMKHKYVDGRLIMDDTEAEAKRLQTRAHIWLDAAIKSYGLGESYGDL